MFLSILYLLQAWVAVALAYPTISNVKGQNISQDLFESLEELARVVDISYCVGTTGIQRPFKCLSRCKDFPGFELVTTWNTGPLLSDSCGYIAVSHLPHPKRVIVAFRGTYSVANTIADLSTNPAEYAPFPSTHENDSICVTTDSQRRSEPLLPQLLHQQNKRSEPAPECKNCTVHAGFMTSWHNTRCEIVPHVEAALNKYPDYELTLVGHSLGGAVAALAALEFKARGWDPRVTTFGEPRIGNQALNTYIDEIFNLDSTRPEELVYRRVTHVDDPVPLLPMEEWGYKMHAGEVYISKSSLPPYRSDLKHCKGDEDMDCIAGGVSASTDDQTPLNMADVRSGVKAAWQINQKYKLWQLFFAHRDYFWRLGLCLPGGDPWDWNRGKYDFPDVNDEL